VGEDVGESELLAFLGSTAEREKDLRSTTPATLKL